MISKVDLVRVPSLDIDLITTLPLKSQAKITHFKVTFTVYTETLLVKTIENTQQNETPFRCLRCTVSAFRLLRLSKFSALDGIFRTENAFMCVFPVVV